MNKYYILKEVFSGIALVSFALFIITGFYYVYSGYDFFFGQKLYAIGATFIVSFFIYHIIKNLSGDA